MSTKIDEAKMKQELAKVYERFIEHPEDKSNYKIAMKKHNKYMHIVGHGFIPEKLEISISNLTEIAQYGAGSQDDEDLLNYANEILPYLKGD